MASSARDPEPVPEVVSTMRNEDTPPAPSAVSGSQPPASSGTPTEKPTAINGSDRSSGDAETVAPSTGSERVNGNGEKDVREKPESDTVKDKEGHQAAKATDATTPKSGLAKLEDKLPLWLSRSIRKPRTWKNFFRCMVAVLATMVLMLVQDSLNVLGQAAFFGLIMSQMLPPSMALSVYIFAFMTLVIGMCTGWAWGCAAMAAALRARSQVLLQQEIQTEQATYTSNANLDAQYQASIFRGAFLDPRSSTVYGVFFFLGAYCFGFIRAKFPRLTLGAIFGTIILDLMCSYGPLFPITQYTLANNLLIPAACFLGIALACTILIFPQSLHSIVLTLLTETCLTPIKALLDLQGAILSSHPGDRETWSGLAEKAYALRKAHVMGAGAVDGQIKLLGLEVSRGRLGPVELVKVVEKGKELGARAYSLASFVMILDERAKALDKLAKSEHHHQHRRKEYASLLEKHRHPGTSISDLIPLLQSSTAPLRSSASTAIGEIISYLDNVNHSRWGKLAGSPTSTRKATLDKLKEEISFFRSQGSHSLLGPFSDAFHPDGRLKKEQVGKLKYSARDLFTCYLITTSLTSFATVVAELLDLILMTESKNEKNKWHFPTNVAKAMKESAIDRNGGNPLDMHRDGSEETLVGEERDEGQEEDVEGEKAGKGKRKFKGSNTKSKPSKQWAKDPDASDPHNGFQRFGRGLYSLWQGLTGVNGIFALKYGIVSMALWTPAVVQSSAYFVYTNRGLWALIMAQTGMGVFTGEQIGSFFLRMGGTIIGLVFGMVAWYIGSQTGSGNPYGVAAATMVIVAFPLFIRITAPMQSPPMIVALMTGVTITFVVGYSWVDEHIYQTANQGSGAGLAGRRALLVIIGFTAAFIVMLFPRPTSARKIVRHSLARNLIDISDLYAAVISGVEEEADWEDEEPSIAVGADVKKEDRGVVQRRERQKLYRARFIKIMERMGKIEPQMKFASLEPGLKGPWPKERYLELQHHQGQIISALALLSGCYARMDVSWAKRLEGKSEMMHPAFIADCLSLFALLHQSLRNGHPLPTTMPIFERLGYHSQHRTGLGSMGVAPRGPAYFRDPNPNPNPDPNPDTHPSERDGPESRDEREQDSDVASSSVSAIVEGEARMEKQEERVVRDLGDDFKFDVMKNEQFALFAVANVALIHITSSLNELHQVVKQLVGERELAGFDRTQDRWARVEMGMTSV